MRPLGWPEEKNAAFTARWNAGATWQELAKEFGLPSLFSVRFRIARLRKTGFKLAGRKRGRSSWAPRRDTGLIRPTIGTIPSATIMDASGRPLATMDAATRTRRAL